MNMQTTARGRAIAKQDEAIASNVAKIEEAKARPTAIQAMASRLNLTPAKLQETLRLTVFKGASDAEFAALIVVANEYKLNPLTKEIFAFPSKGGGITPVVSVDGWVRIIQEHPQSDGFEFNDHFDDKGNLYAIECVMHRRDRSRPIKVVEYMDECRGSGPAWQKTPKRMLRHRALIQAGRYAFGFSGIYVEGDDIPAGYVQQDGGELARNVTPPTREQIRIAHDAQTGELIEDEETARALDAQTDGWNEGPATEQTVEADNISLDAAIAEVNACEIIADVNAKVLSLVENMTEADADVLRAHAGDVIAEMKAGAN